MQHRNDFRLRELRALGSFETCFAEGSPLADALAETKQKISAAFGDQPTIHVTVKSKSPKAKIQKKAKDKAKAKA